MNKLAIATVALAATVMSAQAEYFSAKYAHAIDDKTEVSDEYFSTADLSSNVNVSAALGIRSGVWRQELEMTYANVDIEDLDGFPVSGEFETIGLVGNVYYAPTFGNFEPYIGVGAGVTHFDGEVESISESELALTYKAHVGLAYNVTPAIALDAGYTYVDGKDFGPVDQKERLARVGLRYQF